MSTNTQTSTSTDVTAPDQDLDLFSDEFFGRTKSSDTDDAPKGEDEEESVNETDTQADSGSSEDNDGQAEAEPAAKKVGKQSFQERIDELVRQREETKRAAQAEIEKLRQEFEAKLAAIQPKTPDAQKTPAAPVAAARVEPTPFDKAEDGTDKYPLGEFDPAYIKDLTKFTLLEEQRAIEQKREQDRIAKEQADQEAALRTSWNEKVEMAKTQYPDFDTKGQEMLAALPPVSDDYAKFLAFTLMSMDKGPDVLHYLSSNIEEAKQLVLAGPQKAAIMLGRLEARFLEAETQKPVVKQTKAPEPPAVRARGTNGAFIAVSPDTDDLDAFSAEFFKPKRKK